MHSRPLLGIVGRDRSYSRSSIVSQVQITVETATKAVSTPLCSPIPLDSNPSMDGSVNPVAPSNAHAASERKVPNRTPADSGYDDCQAAVDSLPSALLGLEEVRSPKTMVPRPNPLGSIRCLPSCPANVVDQDSAHDAPREPRQFRRTVSSPGTGTSSEGSAVSVPSLVVRKRLHSNGSTVLLGRVAGLDLRLERQKSGEAGHSEEMQRLVQLIMENKLERVSVRARGHSDGGEPSNQALELD